MVDFCENVNGSVESSRGQTEIKILRELTRPQSVFAFVWLLFPLFEGKY